jgi:hypothetical protein
VQAAEAFQGDIVAEQFLGDQRMPVSRLAPRIPTRNTTGTIAAMSLGAGESVSAVKRIQPAGEIVRELAAEAEALLRRW